MVAQLGRSARILAGMWSEWGGSAGGRLVEVHMLEGARVDEGLGIGLGLHMQEGTQVSLHLVSE